jgi:hypothetical protein
MALRFTLQQIVQRCIETTRLRQKSESEIENLRRSKKIQNAESCMNRLKVKCLTNLLRCRTHSLRPSKAESPRCSMSHCTAQLFCN